MESKTFKSVAFGGFDKQDVISYIEKISGEHTAALEKAQSEADSLRRENAALSEQASALNEQADTQSAEISGLQAELEALRPQSAELETLKPQAEQMRAEIAALRPDAEAYREFRNRIGDIECEARQRAAGMENATLDRLNELVSGIRAEYRDLAAAFDAASGYCTGELRKVEVTLSQIPRALDQTGANLDALSARLRETKAEEEP